MASNKLELCIQTLERKWWGLPLDIVTMGGYRSYQINQYTVCLSKVSDEDYRKYIMALDQARKARESLQKEKLKILEIAVLPLALESKETEDCRNL